jgi:hypothetical protein
MNAIDTIDEVDFGFDLNFYTVDGLRNFIAAADMAIEANVFPIRGAEWSELLMFQRIRDAAAAAIGLALPVQVGFDGDLRYHVTDIIDWYMSPKLCFSEGRDMRETLGFEFD